MTFSIVARSADGRHFGVAVASKFLAVGAMVPAAAVTREGRPGGALATQALANLRYRDEGLRLLAEGRSAKATVEELISADELAAERQLGVVDTDGQAAPAACPGPAARPGTAMRSRATSWPARAWWR